jgi:hypothetical protein
MVLSTALVFGLMQIIHFNIGTAQLNSTGNSTAPPVIQEDNLTSQNGSQVYEDKDVGFTIKYPSDWTIGEEDAQLNTVASFDAPNGGYVNIRVFPQGDYKSIKDYGNTFKKGGSDSTLLAYYRNSSTLIDGKPAFKAIYLTTYNPSIYEKSLLGYSSSTSKAMVLATLVPEKKSIIALFYFADPKDFDVNRPVVEEMFKSFQIGTKGPVIQEED